ncbi:ATP-binding cassette sub-family G member 8 [Brevipalpus obovatus]|uniref:ATP-binding cassette sub-family G member 8 n=1 Tax=Brevipalpus obovatus TaxID=246614 RepID=UPI003D9ECE85
MWDDRRSRKYAAPQSGGIGQYTSGHNGYGNRAYDNTEDLHAWSIYRQNLNADLSESAIGINKSSNTERPFGNFQLREATVKNILNHPKYGPKLRDHDPTTYLRYGLPRAKVAQSELGGQKSSSPHSHSHSQLPSHHHSHHNLHHHSPSLNHHPQHHHHHRAPSSAVGITNNQLMGYGGRSGMGQGMTSDSASMSDDETDVRNMKQQNVRRTWKSDPDLIRAAQMEAESAIHYKKRSNNVAAHHPKYVPSNQVPSMYPCDGKAVSESDLRYAANGYGPPNKQKANGMPYHHSNHIEDDPLNNAVLPKHPHLIVRGLYYELDKTSKLRRFCGAQRTKLRVLDNISFEVKAGEVLAIMATSDFEGTSILDILANRHNKMRSMVKAEITLNGIFMSPKKLSQVISYVARDTTLCPDMSTRQTLLFSSLVQGPAKRSSFDTKKRINAVLEELGLSEVRHTSVASLTEPERRRLLIAMSLLLDTDVLLLDQPTKGMDIFDSFFLVEHLRRWALISGRCVILTIQPATYEIFTMLSQILLVSTGRVLYFGKRRELLSYFEEIYFPCPSLKNPSDYYLDLVTLDNLSSEAMLESSQRIENLVDTYCSKCPNAVSLPGPQSVAPPPIRRSHMTIMFLALWIRALIFTFPYNVIHLFRNIFFALCLSITTGIIYWHVRAGREQEHVWDRIGLYHTILAIMPIPLFLIEINDVHKEKRYVLNEIKLGLYTKPMYLCSKVLYSFLKATLVFMAYSLPVSSMAGLQSNLLLYLLIMITYLHAIRMLAIAMVWTFDAKSTASIVFGIIYAINVIVSGTTIHFRDLSIVTRWLYSVSPMKQSHEVLIGWEFNSNITSGLNSLLSAFQCSHNPIIQQENAILIKADCGFQHREHILTWFNYRSITNDILKTLSTPLITSAIFFLIFLSIGFATFCMLASKKKKDN